MAAATFVYVPGLAAQTSTHDTIDSRTAIAGGMTCKKEDMGLKILPSTYSDYFHTLTQPYPTPVLISL